MDSFGQGVSGIRGLLRVQGHLDGFWLSTPLAVHLTADELGAKQLPVDAEEMGREVKDCIKEQITEDNYWQILKYPLTKLQLLGDPRSILFSQASPRDYILNTSKFADTTVDHE